MIVARFARSNPERSSERSLLLEDHKAYLRNTPIRLLLSGPSAPPAYDGKALALVIAEVDTLAAFEAFSAGDPFVSAGVYEQVEIFEWRPSAGILSDLFQGRS